MHKTFYFVAEFIYYLQNIIFYILHIVYFLDPHLKDSLVTNLIFFQGTYLSLLKISHFTDLAIPYLWKHSAFSLPS